MTSSGVVKWFNNQKGYGFITNADGSGDTFVHFRDIVGEHKTLAPGQRVEFDLATVADGRIRAENVKIVVDAVADRR